jgi:hypothetical protein
VKNSKEFIMILLIVTLLCAGSYIAYDYYYLSDQSICKECKTCEICEEKTDDYHSWCKDDNNCYEQIVGKKFYQVLDQKASDNNVPAVLELKEDNTFAMVVNQCDYLAKAYGTYEVNKDELILHYTNSDYDVMTPEEMVFNITSGDQIIYKGDDLITCNITKIYTTKALMNSLTKEYSN